MVSYIERTEDRTYISTLPRVWALGKHNFGIILNLIYSRGKCIPSSRITQYLSVFSRYLRERIGVLGVELASHEGVEKKARLYRACVCVSVCLCVYLLYFGIKLYFVINLTISASTSLGCVAPKKCAPPSIGTSDASAELTNSWISRSALARE